MRRRRDDSLFDDAFDVLKLTPVWVGPTLAVAAFVILRYVAPALFPARQGTAFDAGGVIRPFLPLFAWLLAGLIIVAWITAEIYKLSNRRLLDTQTGSASVRDLSWQEFERLVCEAYVRKGYVAKLVGTASGDGGIDIELSRPGEFAVVQCKQWRAYKVGVTTVRELLGVVTSCRATKGIVVTSGRFTREAVRFAEGNTQLELVDGELLTQLIGEVQRRSVPSVSCSARPSAAGESHELPACPTCGAAMVKRIARRGNRSGSEFWGCPRYPQCRGTRPAETP